MAVNDDALGDILAHTAWMRRLARRLVADAAERDEVVQAVWVQALLHAPATANLRPWLAAVLRNVVRMRFRGEGRRARREETAPAAPAAAATPEELAGRVEVEREVASALLELGEPYRETLLLRYYEDLSAAQIAERLGVPAATVRSRLKRGLEELRGRLDARSDGDRRRWAVALVPSAVAARGTTAKAIAMAIGGALIMKSAVKLTVAAVLLLLLGWTTAVVWRHRAPGGELTRTQAGVAWHVPGGIGVPGQAPATLAGTRIPDWFGQRGAAVRRIAGRVTVDGAPLAGAVVELGSALSDAGLLPVAARKSGSDGRFDFGLVPPASYTLAATAPEHSPAVVELDTRDPGAASDRVELRLGACAAQLVGHVNDASGGPIAGARLCVAEPRAAACAQSDDGGAYRFCVGPRQSGIVVSAKGYGAILEHFEPVDRTVRRDFLLTPEATIVGRVVRADDGRPVADAEVRSQSGDIGPHVAARGAAITDGNGRFTIAGLAGGRHRLVAVATGLSTSDKFEINVEAGATSPEIVLRLRAAARVSGVVTDGSGPVGGATVAVGGPGPLEHVDAVSQPDGSFVLDSVPRGTITFRIVDRDVVEPKSLVVDRDLDGVRLIVRSLGSIAGHVFRQGKPVANVPVDTDDGRINGFTDDEGAYVLRGLTARKYVVNAEDQVRGIGGLSPEVTLGPGEQRTGVDVECTYAGAISGVVVEDGGGPASGIFVRFDAMHQVDRGGAITGTDGTFRVGTLAGRDEYSAAVMATNDGRHHLAFADGAAPKVFVPSGESEVSGVRIVVKRAHLTIRGSVVDGDGRPLSDVQVAAFRVPGGEERLYTSVFYGNPNAITGADGRFTITDVDGGSFVVRARAGDGSEGGVEGVTAGQDGVVVKLQSTGGIDGQLVGFATPPEVTARRDEALAPWPRTWAVVTGSSFQLRGLPPGPYAVDASGGGGDVQLVRVEAGQVATVTLHNRGSGVVHGRVVEWKSGAPVEGLKCVAMLSSGATFNRDHGEPGFSTADGSFTIEGAPNGPVTVICGWAPSYSDGMANFTVGGADAGGDVTVVKAERLLGMLAFFGGEIAVDPSLTVRLISVLAGSPADKAGLKRGDVLASVDGASVAKLSPVGDEYAIRDHAPGTHVRVGVLRAGQPVTADVVLTGTLIP
jgi:RNA polymerase sigma factor (sigma-70 family)